MIDLNRTETPAERQAFTLKMLGLVVAGGLIIAPAAGWLVWEVVKLSWWAGGGVSNQYVPTTPPLKPVNYKNEYICPAGDKPGKWGLCN